jgi:hypothetical protein
MNISRKFSLVLAVTSTLLTLGLGAWAAVSVLSASSEATAAQASYLQFETKLVDLQDEKSAASSRLSEIPAEYDDAWRTCMKGIVDEVFNGGKTPAQQKACDDWPLLEIEKSNVERRITTIESETQTARSQSNTWQVKALEADQKYSTTLTFGAVGVGVLVLATVTLWFAAMRKNTGTAGRVQE